METSTLESAVGAGNDFELIQTPRERSRIAVRMVEEPEADNLVAAVARQPAPSDLGSTVQQLVARM